MKQQKIKKVKEKEEVNLINLDPYMPIKILQNEINQSQMICDVCLEDDDFEDDEIIICDLCSAATH